MEHLKCGWCGYGINSKSYLVSLHFQFKWSHMSGGYFIRQYRSTCWWLSNIPTFPEWLPLTSGLWIQAPPDSSMKMSNCPSTAFPISLNDNMFSVAQPSGPWYHSWLLPSCPHPVCHRSVTSTFRIHPKSDCFHSPWPRPHHLSSGQLQQSPN